MLSLLRSGLSDLRTRPAKQITGLDALRACAVLLVIFDHFRANVWLPLGGDAGFWLASNPLTMYGWTGVDLFLVLSGFFIGAQVWKERDRTGGFRAGRFFLRRGFRIWPLYFVSMIALLVGLGRTRPQWPDWLLVSNYWRTDYARSWSLSTEEHFYLVVPLLILLTLRRPMRVYPWLIAAAWVAVDVTRFFTSRTLLGRGMTEWEADQAMYFPFHLHNQGLLVGLLLAFAVTMRPEWFRRADDAGWSWRGTWIAVAMAVVGLGLRAASGLVFSYTALALIYGGLVVFVLFDRSWFSRLTGGWPWYLVSRLSYGMYLNHLMFGSAIIVAATRALRQAQLGDTATYLLALGLTIALSMAMALCTFLLVEHPFLLLRERLVRRAPGATTATVASAGSLAAMVPPLSGAPSREPALDAPRR